MQEPCITLSIIIPCYNVESTIARALDSILFQQVNFSYEILCVDDASTDDSVAVIQNYTDKYDFIHLLKNPSNAGNAETFYNGLKASRGKYFIVLDGDDFYTLRTKLQMQVDFLDNDTNEEYCAVTHYHILYKDDGTINIPNFNSNIKEYTYKNFLERNYQYHHTSTYMFRNIYHGNPPELLKDDAMRGDHPRIFLELILTNKKIKILPFFGSVYNYNFKGIWSSLDFENKIKRNIKFCTAIKNLTNSSYEKSCMDKWINNFSKDLDQKTNNFDATPVTITKDNAIDNIKKTANNFTFENDYFSFNSIYKSLELDTLCATLGYIQMLELKLNVLVPAERDPNLIMIIVRELTAHGGGIAAEIKEIASIFNDKHVVIFCTESSTTDIDFTKSFTKNCTFIFIPDDCNDRLKYSFEQISKIRPSRIYFYVGHNNPIINCLIQPALSYNIHVFSYDHVFVLGIDNPNFHSFMVKRVVDFKLLKNNSIKNIIFIPVWASNTLYNKKYKPFYNHKKLITATAAARWYKCNGSWPYNYLDLILETLLKTGGTHIHYGSIPDEYIDRIKKFLISNNLPDTSFINIPWADHLGLSLLENNVDIFIEPFPVVSAKISLIAQSAGIPILRYAGMTRLSMADFVYKEALEWSTKEEFIHILSNLTPSVLETQSSFSTNDFNNNHDINVVKSYIRDNKSFQIEDIPYIADNFIQNYNTSVKTSYIPENQTTPSFSLEDFDKMFRKWHPDLEFIKMKNIYFYIEYLRCKMCLIFSKNKQNYKKKLHQMKCIINNNGTIIYIEPKS